MMRPMKLAGSELVFGNGSLEYIKSVNCERAAIVVGGSSMEKNGTLAKVEALFKESGVVTTVISGVEPDPSIETVLRGAKEMVEFNPDLIVGLGGGSAMDAAKAMWIFYEHPDLKDLQDILPPNIFPKLRKKARLCCIPSTSGTASEVSRSIVITENSTGLKYGIGNMEMMPDIAICDGNITVSMPSKITAETGMDALTHALEALVSNRANYLSDILAKAAIKDIFKFLPKAYKNGEDKEARELMLQASMVAGLAFTNVSLGIVHSMAHTLGSVYHISHGLADAIILPYVISYNKQSEIAKEIYKNISDELGIGDIEFEIKRLNKEIPNREDYISKLDILADFAKKDGCTKTNPVIPEIEGFKELFIKVYDGSKEN